MDKGHAFRIEEATMSRSWPRLERHDVLAFVIGGALFVGFVAFIALAGPHFKPRLTGFNESDWECTALPQSEPVCVRHLDHSKQN